MMRIIQFAKQIYRKYEEQFRYAIVGGLTTIVSLASYFVGVLFFLDPHDPFQLQIANISSWVCAVTFAFFANRAFVFKSTSRILTEASKFVGARLSTLLMEMFFMSMLVIRIGMNDKAAKLLVQIAIFVLNYIFSKFMVFNKKEAKDNKETF